MEQTPIFVYAKNNKIAVLSFHEASNGGYILERQGYVHTATLDACSFIQNLHNHATDEEKVQEINNLSVRYAERNDYARKA